MKSEAVVLTQLGLKQILTHLKVIASAATRFKMRRVYTAQEFGVPVSIIEIPMMTFSLPQLPSNFANRGCNS
jgi:hypothetical protein